MITASKTRLRGKSVEMSASSILIQNFNLKWPILERGKSVEMSASLILIQNFNLKWPILQYEPDMMEHQLSGIPMN